MDTLVDGQLGDRQSRAPSDLEGSWGHDLGLPDPPPLCPHLTLNNALWWVLLSRFLGSDFPGSKETLLSTALGRTSIKSAPPVGRTLSSQRVGWLQGSLLGTGALLWGQCAWQPSCEGDRSSFHRTALWVTPGFAINPGPASAGGTEIAQPPASGTIGTARASSGCYRSVQMGVPLGGTRVPMPWDVHTCPRTSDNCVPLHRDLSKPQMPEE